MARKTAFKNRVLTHLPRANAAKRDGSVDMVELGKDNAKAQKKLGDGTETILDVESIDFLNIIGGEIFFHVATDKLEDARDRLVAVFDKLIAKRDAKKKKK